MNEYKESRRQSISFHEIISSVDNDEENVDLEQVYHSLNTFYLLLVCLFCINVSIFSLAYCCIFLIV